jgi:hypothetical protein
LCEFHPVTYSAPAKAEWPSSFTVNNSKSWQASAVAHALSILRERPAHARLKYFAYEASANRLGQFRRVAPWREQEAGNHGDELGFRHDRSK